MKTLKRILLALLALILVAGTIGWFSLDKETRGLLKTFPTNRDLLFWNQAQRDAAFLALDRIRCSPSGTRSSPRPRHGRCPRASRSSSTSTSTPTWRTSTAPPC